MAIMENKNFMTYHRRVIVDQISRITGRRRMIAVDKNDNHRRRVSMVDSMNINRKRLKEMLGSENFTHEAQCGVGHLNFFSA